MEKKDRQIQRRLGFVLLSFLMGIFFLIYRLGYIKLVNGEEYEKKAIGQQLLLDQQIPARRGGIYDRNQHILALDYTVYNLILDTVVLHHYEKEEHEKTINFLKEIVEIPQEELWKHINSETQRYYIVLRKEIPQQEGQKIQEEIKTQKIKGVWLEEDSLRNYNYDSLASHVIGFVGAKEGRLGLELQYNRWLTGIPGRNFRTFEQGHYVMKNYIQPTHGLSLILTIDEAIQHYTEEALLEAMREYEPESASAIVMVPKTGEILAMTSFPNFNSNKPGNIDHLVDAERYQTMTQEERTKMLNKVWQNFNITYTYEPGSTFKPMVVAAALEENVISISDTFYCGGYKNVAGTIIRCWKRSGHGEQTIEEILANSCNVGMMDIAEKMGKEVFYRYQKAFGFGTKTGIDLPGEQDAAGLLHKEENLGPVELATSSFGQTFNATPIQMITAFTAVINGGNLVRPHLVAQMIDSNGNPVQEADKEIRKKVISEKTSKQMRETLESVVTAGTGRGARIPGFRIGGKTGTAEQGSRTNPEEHRYIFSFIGFAPVEDPQVIVFVALNRPKDDTIGSTMVTTVCKNIMERTLPYLGISKTEVLEKEDNQEPTISDYTDLFLMDAIQDIKDQGLQYEIVGKGSTIVNQMPKAGTKVPVNTLVYLYVTANDTQEVVEVPNVIGSTYEEAFETIKKQYLIPTFIGEGNIVEGQEPKSGTRVDKNTEVIIQLKK
ncbi:MAG: PASTA domain-containing protein [Epulopiscium sp.]|nr:PASTA domain-containing protein [Candidatus Epulonipiscium sp.]